MRLAPDFVLPIDALSIKLAILATSGAGKTNTGTVIAEETLHEKGQLVVIDPQGDWWGIRSSADGKRGGYPVLIMGGPHGDVPLSATSGKLVADIVVNEALSAVLDTSDFSNADHIRFCTDFATQLFQRKNTANTPLLLICEEAEAVAPQQPFGEETRMLAIFQRLAKRGRRRGINILPISQRSASVNKNFLSQCRGGILMQTVGTQDRNAVDEWLKGYDTEGKRAEVIKSLATLQVGEGIVWIPQMKIFRKVAFRKRQTFDSSATPKQGEQRIEPKVLSPVDIERITKAMQQVVQKEHDNDPVRLKARIKALEREVEMRMGTVNERRIEVPVLPDGYIESVANLVEALDKALGSIGALDYDMGAVSKAVKALPRKAGTVSTHPTVERAQTSPRSPHNGSVLRSHPKVRGTRISEELVAVVRPANQPFGDITITKPHRKLLDVLAWWKGLGFDRVGRVQLAVIAGYSPKAGAFNNYLGRLRTAELIEYPESGMVALTATGAELADPGKVPTTPEEVQEDIYRRLPAPKAKLLSILVHTGPLTREKLAEEAEYSPSAGAFNNYLGSLRSLGLITYPGKGMVAPAPVLFLEEAS